jgi:protein-tyrosine phosphatase
MCNAAGAKMRESFDVLVLCAMEHQPTSRCFPGVQVVHAPFDDSSFLSTSEIRIAQKASIVVANAVRKGKRVVVTCWLGRNRSGLVTALALVRLGASPDAAIDAVRMARGPEALSNPTFVDLILSAGRRRDSDEVSYR